MQETNRARLYEIWLKVQAGELTQDREEANLGKAMLEHSEFHHIWNRLGNLKDDELVILGENPILHIISHSAIEEQIARDDPPELQKTLDVLLIHGVSRHEAIHAIAYEFMIELYKMMKTLRPFNQIAYKRRINKLAKINRS